MTARNLASMSPTERRRALLRMAGRVLIIWFVLLGAYFIIPIGHESAGLLIVRVVADVALVVAVIWWQGRRIVRADYPEIRAMEALGSILVVFLVLFASGYLAMSYRSAKTFTQPLDHMRALYFTITVFSTVGFGDITPTTNAGRGLVSVQMLLDLALLGAVVRLLTTAVRTGLSQQSEA